MTAGEVLLQVQRLLGEPAGAYFDFRFRMQELNRAQANMVQDALASTATIQLPVTADGVFLPEDYLTLGTEAPYYVEGVGRPHVKLEVTAPGWMDRYVPGWTDAPSGAPRYFVMEGGGNVRLYPSPKSGEVVVTYVNAPDTLWGEEDELFSGDPSLARYGAGLAYKVAAAEVMGLNPEMGLRYLNLYEMELRRMRHNQRVTPARYQRLRARFQYARGRN